MTTATPFRVPEVIASELRRFLEEQIVFGELPPHTRLVEEELVRRHGVSRSPVREALRLLEQDGLAVRESRRGVRVSPVDLKDLDEIYTCRRVLEGLAAEGAAAHRTEADVATLRDALTAMQAAYDRRDLRAYFQQNVALTTQINVVSRNATLTRLLGSIGKQALRYRYIAYSRSPEMLTASIEGNHEIIDAIAQRRARIARTLMEGLIQRSWEAVRTHVGALEGTAIDGAA